MSVIWGAHLEQGSQIVALQGWLPCRLFSETLTDLAAHSPRASGQLLWSWSLRVCRRLESKSRHLRVLRQRGLLPAQSPSVRWLVLLWTSCHHLGQVLIDAWRCVLNTFTLLLPTPTFVCLFLNPQRHLACEFVPFPDRFLVSWDSEHRFCHVPSVVSWGSHYVGMNSCKYKQESCLKL